MVRTHSERGAEVLEAAIVLPMLIVLAFCLVQVCLIAYEGTAMSAAIESAAMKSDFSAAIASGNVNQAVKDELASNTPGIVKDNITVTNSKVSYSDRSDEATVTDSGSTGITIFTAIMLAGAALVGGYGIAMALLVGIIGAVGGWAVCGVWLSHAGKTRGEEIDRYLPPALELLTISVSAGVLVERGFRQLAENKALGPLADEFARTDMEISHLGVSRVDALDHMRRRCDSPLMGYFCAALIEATRKGTSISGVLESQAKLARKARYDALTAQINKLSTKMAVPLVFFLIAVLVLILPPLIIPTASMLMEIM